MCLFTTDVLLLYVTRPLVWNRHLCPACGSRAFPFEPLGYSAHAHPVKVSLGLPFKAIIFSFLCFLRSAGWPAVSSPAEFSRVTKGNRMCHSLDILEGPRPGHCLTTLKSLGPSSIHKYRPHTRMLLGLSFRRTPFKGAGMSPTLWRTCLRFGWIRSRHTEIKRPILWGIAVVYLTAAAEPTAIVIWSQGSHPSPFRLDLTCWGSKSWMNDKQPMIL